VLVRGASFVAVFGLMAAWELRTPARTLHLPRRLRRTNNLALVVLNTALLRLLYPAAAVGGDHGWVVLNHLAAPPVLAAVVAIVALDFAVWLQHEMVHAGPLLWRVHRVHHADPDYDLTTGARFHPIEIVLSMLIKHGHHGPREVSRLPGLLGLPFCGSGNGYASKRAQPADSARADA
jgi:sterol desaturase/sphingolipid hydroxylase (fatty acid hydroxylase superfamily)